MEIDSELPKVVQNLVLSMMRLDKPVSYKNVGNPPET